MKSNAFLGHPVECGEAGQGEFLSHWQSREQELIKADNHGARAVEALRGLAELMSSEYLEVRERAKTLLLEARELT